MLIFDGDYPMAYGALELNRDLTLPIDEIRAADPDSKNVPFACLPEMRRGGIFCALMKFTIRYQWGDAVLTGYRSSEGVYGAAKGQVAYYQMLERCGEGVILRSGKELSEHARRWEGKEDFLDQPIGFILGMEGADPILEPEQVYEWLEEGVRVVSLTHYGPSRYAQGTGTEGGLRPQAVDLLREMDNCGMLLDMTHIADQSFWEALEFYSGPILASHQNCRSLAPGTRQFTDEQLKAVIERGGVIGASMDTWMLRETQDVDWADTGSCVRRDHFPRSAVSLKHIADHIDHVCQLAGNAGHAAIGGDTDGQGGVDGAPFEIDTVVDYGKLVPILEARGYSESDISDVMYRNWLRFYEKHLPSSGG